MYKITKNSVTIIIVGFGYGKTTLLKNIVKQHPNKKFIIIENEFGDININKQLINTKSENNIFELTNGFIYCNLNTELGLLLNLLIKSGVEFDNLIIETTGIADPGQFVQIFLSGSRVNRYFEFNNVICLVDTNHFYLQFEQIDEVKKQIINADTIIINKIDTVESEKVEKIETLIRTINNSCEIIKTSHSVIDGKNILDIYRHKAENIEQTFNQFTLVEADHSGKNFIINQDKHDHHHHDHEIESVSITLGGQLVLTRFAVWLDNFLFFSTEEIYRFKGILNAMDTNNRFVLQGVYKTFSIYEGSEWRTDELRRNQFVFIGKNIDKNNLQRYIQSLIQN